jgi:uncharacterized protein YjbI with pentapeptide repeats
MRPLFKYAIILALAAGGAVLLRDLSLVLWGGYVWKAGTGFGGKTVWDWLDLLFVPLSIAVVAAWFTWRQDSRDQEIARETLREKELQAYLETLSDLILTQRLRRSRPDSEVRKLAAAHTLRVFRRLDTGRKQVLLRFLYETGLVSGQTPVIPMDHVDLQGIDLNHTDLTGINLCNTRLEGANFSNAYLVNCYLNNVMLAQANLSGTHLNGSLLNNANLCQAALVGAQLVEARLLQADLSGADLSGANLTNANLLGAKVADSQLEKTGALFNTRLPNGEIHPG